MNIQEMDIIKTLYDSPFRNQRELAEQSGYSLGAVNQSIKSLTEQQFLDKNGHLTDKAKRILQKNSPQRAVILAAGQGMRMVPINTEQSKALLKVRGQVLIERLITQLHQAGIREIYVVVGFLKEQFEYLMDDYGVELVVNPQYDTANNLYSLDLANEYLANAYVLPCDIWLNDNPFHSRELYSWYMVRDQIQSGASVRVNRKMELVPTGKNKMGNPMVGVCYLTAPDAAVLSQTMNRMCGESSNRQCFWEEALFKNNRIFANVIPDAMAVELDTFEQVQELDGAAEQLQNTMISEICTALHAAPAQIRDIQMLKKGTTNRTFLFTCRDRKYVMHLPSENAENMVNRQQEAAVYRALSGSGLGEEAIALNPQSGCRITRYLEDSRCCNMENEQDVSRCMAYLKNLHGRRIQVEHSFNLWEQIQFYEDLRGGTPSVYRDYEMTKAHILSLRDYMEKHSTETVLTHLDPVADNFLFSKDDRGEEILTLIDWEYGAMQDPRLDVAMFGINALYRREKMDRLIELYFENKVSDEDRIQVYCYVAVCGFMWSNWCEYNRKLGVEFGEYSLRQYRYAKDYYRFALELMENR